MNKQDILDQDLGIEQEEIKNQLDNKLIPENETNSSHFQSQQDLSEYQSDIYVDDQKNPLTHISKLNYFTFIWMIDLLKLSYRKILQQEDVFPLRKIDSSSYNYRRLYGTYNLFGKQSSNGNSDTEQISLIKLIWNAFKRDILILWGITSILTVGRLLNPLLADMITKVMIEQTYSNLFMILIFTILMFLLLGFGWSNKAFYDEVVKARISGALSSKIMDKLFKFAIVRNTQFKAGVLQNLLVVDILQINQYWGGLFGAIIFPIQFICALYIGYTVVGSEKTWIAFGVSFVQLILTLIFGYFYQNLQTSFMIKKDIRMSKIDEMLNGVKQIKLNQMEELFQNRIQLTREQELKQLYKQKILSAFLSSFSGLFTILNLLIVVNSTGITSLSDLIKVNSTYSTIQSFVLGLPSIVVQLVMGSQSFARLQTFLDQEELYQSSENLQQNNLQELLSSHSNNNSAIDLSKNSFSWKQQQSSSSENQNPQNRLQQPNTQIFNLIDIEFQIKKGEFVAFVGETGSGKSSIIYAILGEMLSLNSQNLKKNSLKINGKLSYASQQPWIVQGSVQYNIVYDEAYDEQRYQSVLKYCCLNQDLASMKDKDQTQIAERGETLSGGQKKRINLARTIYKNSDIYLLDDALSGLDYVVQKQIIDGLFLTFLHEKTKILFTSYLDHLQRADKIFLTEKGRIIFQGNFQQCKSSGLFNNFLQKEHDSYQENLNSLQKNELAFTDQFKQGEESKQFQEINQHSDLIQSQSLDQQVKNQLLLEDEDKSIGSLPYSLYKKLCLMFFGICPFILVIFLGILQLSFQGLAYSMITEDTNKNTTNVTNSTNTTNIVPTSEITIDQEKDTKSPESGLTDSYNSIIIKYCLAFVVFNLVIFLRNYYLATLSVKFSQKIHNNIIIRLLKASFPKFYNVISTGRINNRLSKDIYYLDNELSMTIDNLITAIFLILGTGLAFFIMGLWPHKIIVSLYIVNCVYVGYIYLRGMREITRLEAVSRSPILSLFNEVIQGAVFVKNCVKKNFIMNIFENRLDQNIRNNICQGGYQAFFLAGVIYSDMICLVILILISFYLSPPSTDSTGKSQNNPQIFALQLASGTAGITIFIMLMATNLQIFMINFERCISLQDNVQIEKDLNLDSNSNPDELLEIDNQNIRLQNIQTPQQAGSKVFEFKNASFKYRDDCPFVIKNLNWYVLENQKIGVVGRTGAGKTSITMALTKIIEINQGDLIFKNQQSTNMKLQEIRRQFSVIPQDPFIFQGTIKENIDPLGLYKDNDGFILKIVQETGINQHQIFKSKGIYSEITILGDNLSYGEKQLISIARALVRQSNIILIDEATSNIDQETEQIITNAIEKAFKNKTIITIAHKIKTILKSDLVMVIDQGKILEYDNPVKLMSQNDSYFKQIVDAMQQAHE